MSGLKDPFALHAGLVAVVAVVGVTAVALLAEGRQVRTGAMTGVAVAVFSAAVALPLKRWASQRGVQDGLKVLGAVFGVRMVLVAGGVLWARAKGWGPVPFTAGFFGAYFALQWIEISYLLAEQKRGRNG